MRASTAFLPGAAVTRRACAEALTPASPALRYDPASRRSATTHAPDLRPQGRARSDGRAESRNPAAR
eukprot:CAMPEP_0176111454 /NCGR_PEP_ID=MMETSP0120_2-20121206/55969_1 /TAXON_ID=160619 /ORGANISM="Kryptoperidinium foliaceum, Strain CCMP 1326" /LENGTH=66 /DNA_ID=CAMNT_0017445671 /DNA_START=417 /DNA_END=615 /DNA_ORIENTATION=+